MVADRLLGPVVLSNFILTKSLANGLFNLPVAFALPIFRHLILISNVLILAVQKLLTFFQQKMSVFLCAFEILISLINDVVSFQTTGP